MSQEVRNLFLKSRKDLAEGMSFNKWRAYPWGIVFSWESNPLLSANFAYVTNSLENTNDLLEWYKSSSNTKIFSEIPLDLEESGYKIALLEGEGSNIGPPVFPDLNIKKFSFRSRDLKYKIDQFSTRIANFFTLGVQETEAIDRYIRAVVHMHDGVIWTLEDQNEQLVTGLVVSNYQLMETPFYLISVYHYSPEIGSIRLLKDLISLFLTSNKKMQYYVIERKNTPEFEMYQSLGFQEKQVVMGYSKVFER